MAAMPQEIEVSLSDRQAERREFWRAVFLACSDLHVMAAGGIADAALDEYDERFSINTTTKRTSP